MRDSYSQQWREYVYKGRIWNWRLDDRIKTFLYEVECQAQELQGKIMVDVGCGSGVITMTLAERFYLETIGFDYSNSVEQAYKKNKSPLCHFLQANIFYPPFRRHVFNIVYSHGVIHHTHNPRSAFLSILPLVKSGGKVYIWVYGKKKGYNRVKFLFIAEIRKFVSILPNFLRNISLTLLSFFLLIHQYIKNCLKIASVEMPTWWQIKVGVRDRYSY